MMESISILTVLHDIMILFIVK